MSFESNNLSVLAYANGFTFWHYSTADNDVGECGYFDSASDLLRIGDVILANYSTDRNLKTKMIHVANIDEGAVVVERAA